MIILIPESSVDSEVEVEHEARDIFASLEEHHE